VWQPPHLLNMEQVPGHPFTPHRACFYLLFLNFFILIICFLQIFQELS
jgi:hypothetical protein